MTAFGAAEERSVIAAYRNARKQGRSFEKAYDVALETYCEGHKLPKTIRTKVDVGVLIAQAQRKYGSWADGRDA